MNKKVSSESVVKDIRRRTRKKYSSEGRNDRIEKLKKSEIKDYLILYMDQIWLEDWLKEKVDKLEMELERGER